MNMENYIESQYRELIGEINYEYIRLYESFSHQKLQEIFSTIHHLFVTNYKSMNSRLPTNKYGAHFWAEPSRSLIKAITILRGLQRTLNDSGYAFELDPYYENIVTKSEEFLSESGGSQLPANMEKIVLYYTLPIIHKLDAISLENEHEKQRYANLKFIAEGSYAKVFSYFDPFYNRKFVLKRAKKELNEKELERFKQEYEQMKKLSSPYIIDVFFFDDTRNEYVMEYMDFTLEKYYEKYNPQLSKEDRKRIAGQILRAFKYIHSKGLLHRDISPNNILLRIYEDVKVVKVSDFGLVKVPDNSLTTINTEFKGRFNDPILVTEGFSSYGILHETYAITRLIYFVMSGKINVSTIKDMKLKSFVEKGLSPNLDQRYKSVDEMILAIKVI